MDYYRKHFKVLCVNNGSFNGFGPCPELIEGKGYDALQGERDEDYYEIVGAAPRELGWGLFIIEYHKERFLLCSEIDERDLVKTK